MKILLLEDDVALRFMFKEALESFGHDVIATGTIEAASEAISMHRPPLIILDLMIDGEMSVDLAGLAEVASPNCEVIFVTGSGMFPNAELFDLNVKTSSVLRKPVDIHHLGSLVDHIANTRADVTAV
ncbi:MAG: response regulator [Marinovum sp.]|nr:response regulator [Marinovum sp.]